MYDEKITATLKKITLKQTSEDNVVRNICEATMETAYEPRFAEALDIDDPSYIRDGIKAKLDIAVGKKHLDMIISSTYITESELTIRGVEVMKAIITSPSKEEEPPLLKFTCSFIWDDKSLLYLAHNLNAELNMELKPLQMSLLNTKKVKKKEETKGTGKGKGKAEKSAKGKKKKTTKSKGGNAEKQIAIC